MLALTSCGGDDASSGAETATVDNVPSTVEVTDPPASDAVSTLATFIGAEMPFDNQEFNTCIVEALIADAGVTADELLQDAVTSAEGEGILDTTSETVGLECLTKLSTEELQVLAGDTTSSEDMEAEASKVRADYSEDELVEIELAAAADQSVVQYALADIDAITVTEGEEFSFTATAYGFTLTPVIAVPCPDDERLAHMIITNGDDCDTTTLIPLMGEGNSGTITATATGKGMCWGLGDMTGTETAALCLPHVGETLK